MIKTKKKLVTIHNIFNNNCLRPLSEACKFEQLRDIFFYTGFIMIGHFCNIKLAT